MLQCASQNDADPNPDPQQWRQKQIFKFNISSHCYYFKNSTYLAPLPSDSAWPYLWADGWKHKKNIFYKQIFWQKVCCGHSLANVDHLFSDFWDLSRFQSIPHPQNNNYSSNFSSSKQFLPLDGGENLLKIRGGDETTALRISCLSKTKETKSLPTKTERIAGISCKSEETKSLPTKRLN